MKRNYVVCLFDYTGFMARPWLEAGYNTILADIQHPEGWRVDMRHQVQDGYGMQYTVGCDLEKGFDIPDWLEGRIYLVVGFPECTNVAVSGARWFQDKGPRGLALSLNLFATCKELGEASGAPYMIENPVSTFSTYCGKPQHTFDPYEYGGYLPENDQHPTYPEIIPPNDAYTKKTCLWTGNGFVMPAPRPVEVSDTNHIHNALGGKSARTKNIRSATPRGFARAVFEANHGVHPDETERSNTLPRGLVVNGI